MPSLPFTLDDLVNLNITDQSRASEEAKPDMRLASAGTRAQSFLRGKIGQMKEHMSSADGFIDIGLAMNPVTRVVDMGAKFFGQPGIQEGFTKGTTMTGDVRVPRMPF